MAGSRAAPGTDGAPARITAVTCVKNEGPFLLEWVAYNRLIGVTDFLIYSNDCTDGTDALLDALAPAGVVHLLNPAEGRNYQMEALKDARAQPLVTEADWIWVSDVDEFLDIHVGAGRIPDLIGACGAPDAISLHFLFFANCGVERFEDRPVIEQFTRCHNPDIWTDQLAIEVKTLYSSAFPVWYVGAHRPFTPRGRERTVRWTDGSGRPVPDAFLTAANRRRIRKFPARGARRFATLNHYALRSLESYVVKTDRGDVNRENRSFDTRYWRERNDPAVEERSILRHLPALRAEMARLRDLPGVGVLHERAVAAHSARAAELLACPAGQEMRAALRAAPRIPASEAEVIRLLDGAQ